MRLIGHRGCAARGPENTLDAVRRALPHVDAVEVDVRRCATGELVVVHDAAVDRLAGVDQLVSETPWNELRDLPVLGTDARVPLLSELVETLPPGVGLNVELKERGLCADVDRAVSARDDVWVSSFEPRALAGTTLPRAFLFTDDWESGLHTALDLDCVAVHPNFELVIDEPARIDQAHESGLTVNVWTPPTRLVPALRAVGVDGVIVDDWAEHEN